MSDDEVDQELLALLRQSLGLTSKSVSTPPETRVLQDAEYVYNNSIDVAIDSFGTKAAALNIWNMMQEKGYSRKTWSTHELHPKTKDESTVNFIFTMDLLNYCFWSDKTTAERFTIDYHGTRWTGYWSLVAALQRALEEGPDSSPHLSLRECLTGLSGQRYRSPAQTSGKMRMNVQLTCFDMCLDLLPLRLSLCLTRG